jgi:hypothetical protein
MTSKSKAQLRTTTADADPKSAPAIIVFGLDQDNKPRAASFTAEQVEHATKAAELMKLRVLKVEGPELTELAARLETGRIYASGHGFVPPIRTDVYGRIDGLADRAAAPGLPRSWDEIDVGHLVLATEDPGEGYWETIVVARHNDMLTLKWVGYPKYPQLVCHRSAVGLLKPTATVPSTAA